MVRRPAITSRSSWRASRRSRPAPGSPTTSRSTPAARAAVAESTPRKRRTISPSERAILLRGRGGEIWDESRKSLTQSISEASQEVGTFPTLVPLEVLYCALVLLRRRPAFEGAKVATLPGLGILLARVEAVFARREFADHLLLPCLCGT